MREKWKQPKKKKPFEPWKGGKKDICISPYHNPPSHLYIPPGQKFVHVCPSCGQRTVIVGSGPMMKV